VIFGFAASGPVASRLRPPLAAPGVWPTRWLYGAPDSSSGPVASGAFNTASLGTPRGPDRHPRRPSGTYWIFQCVHVRGRGADLSRALSGSTGPSHRSTCRGCEVQLTPPRSYSGTHRRSSIDARTPPAAGASGLRSSAVLIGSPCAMRYHQWPTASFLAPRSAASGPASWRPARLVAMAGALRASGIRVAYQLFVHALSLAHRNQVPGCHSVVPPPGSHPGRARGDRRGKTADLARAPPAHRRSSRYVPLRGRLRGRPSAAGSLHGATRATELRPRRARSAAFRDSPPRRSLSIIVRVRHRSDLLAPLTPGRRLASRYRRQGIFVPEAYRYAFSSIRAAID